MRRHKWYEEIIAFAEGEVIQSKLMWEEEDRWFDEDDPDFCDKDVVFRIKPKESEWWENIPEHGVLVKSKITANVFAITSCDGIPNPELYVPLTNEEIERFKR